MPRPQAARSETLGDNNSSKLKLFTPKTLWIFCRGKRDLSDGIIDFCSITICCLGKSVCPISRLRFATSIRIATAKGVLRPTLCNARATDAKPKVIPVGRLLQEQIGTSTSDIPGGNLSILILNRKSTAHNHNQHAGNIGSTCAHLRKSAAGRAPPEPGTRKMAGTQNAHHTQHKTHTTYTHKCTTQHSTAQNTHNIHTT